MATTMFAEVGEWLIAGRFSVDHADRLTRLQANPRTAPILPLHATQRCSRPPPAPSPAADFRHGRSYHVKPDGTIILPVGQLPPDLGLDEAAMLTRARLAELRRAS